MRAAFAFLAYPFRARDCEKPRGLKIARDLGVIARSSALVCFVMFSLCPGVTQAQQKQPQTQQKSQQTEDQLRQAVQNGDRAALERLTMRAENGVVAAQYWLGVLYATGQGVPKNTALAARWFRRGAERGDAASQNNLAGMYANGEGGPRDLKEAFIWFRKAAEQGYGPAQRNLGGMYRDGEGVDRDLVLAYLWFNLAAEQGIESASKSRDKLEIQMTNEQIVEARKLSKYWKPSNAK